LTVKNFLLVKTKGRPKSGGKRCKSVMKQQRKKRKTQNKI
jgi:hypothetical protein